MPPSCATSSLTRREPRPPQSVSSPNVTPRARAVAMTSLSGGTLRVRPQTSARGTPTMSGGANATILSNSPSSKQLNGFAAESCGQRPVEARGRAAALQVAQDHAPRLLPGQFAEPDRDLMAHAAEPFHVPGRRLLEQRALSIARDRAFGDDDDAEASPPLLARHDPPGDDVDVEGNFGNENGVGTASHPRVERDPSGIAPHHLGHHDAVMRLGRRVQPVDGVGRETHRRVEPETVGRAANVVVDGLRHADEGHATLGKFVGNRQRPVPADDDERVEAELVEHVDAALRVVARAVAGLDRIEEGVAPVHRCRGWCRRPAGCRSRPSGSGCGAGWAR